LASGMSEADIERDMKELTEAVKDYETAQEEGKRVRELTILNPFHYHNLLNRLEPVFEKHKHGFISMSSKAEVKAFTEALKKKYNDPETTFTETQDEDGNTILVANNQRFAYLHSGMPAREQDAVFRAFREGRIEHLVNIRMMDEGQNIPDL